MARSADSWCAPHQDHMVDIPKLLDGAHLVKSCHGCNTDVWDVWEKLKPKPRHPPKTKVIISKAAGGFFACSDSSGGRRKPNSEELAAHRHVFCRNCIQKYVPGGIDSCFERTPNGWKQKFDKCWHCQHKNEKGKCIGGCPRVAHTMANLKEGKGCKGLKRKAEGDAEGESEAKNQRTPVLTFEEQAILLSEEVKGHKWFTQKPRKDCLFFVPEFFKKRNGSTEVGHMGFQKEKEKEKFIFPRAVHWLPATEENGKARLYCACKEKADGTCLHIRVLELLVDFDGLQTQQPIVREQPPDTQTGQAAATKVKIGALECYAIFQRGDVKLVGRHMGQWFCQCKKSSK